MTSWGRTPGWVRFNGRQWQPLAGTPDGYDLIITYIRGEPVISIFEPEQTPLAEEYFEPQIGYSQSEKWINQVIKPRDQHATAMGRVSGSGHRHLFPRHWNMWTARTSQRPKKSLDNFSQDPIRIPLAIWESSIWVIPWVPTLGSCDQSQTGLYPKRLQSLPTYPTEQRNSMSFLMPTAERVHQTWQSGRSFLEGQDESEISLSSRKYVWRNTMPFRHWKGCCPWQYWKKTVGEQPLSGSWVLPPICWSKSQSTSTITNHETLSCDDHRNIQPHPDNVPSTSHDQTLRQPHGDTQQDSPCIHIPTIKFRFNSRTIYVQAYWWGTRTVHETKSGWD